ncbi:MAG TPA: Xaa-Pro peptidase family protein [Bryobacteraceae bacterium]|nr:Xaa-Pro peptidase family protein [Bryobacteraceae bacterium]HOL70061.1 Xaa-Pro peptidase family protein [Bryobacteraceae bacterium]HOQ46207.1 Xaa-Pro peptidase family protein [Bryobacteraceae bacterium]HPQ15370.1 Xaa-Pro peptidase family protein [Bryobacteraceae bacterium]HPU74010.1 Xaa-Pro peptidase family protein [Bryobacteraceae bacterium]
MDLTAIQQHLKEEGLDGWLFFDHHQRDPLAYRILGLPQRAATRRWYYLIPANGEPRGLVHRIEASVLEGLPGSVARYASWAEQVEGLRRLLEGCRRIAMQYSPQCAIPYVSMVDAGTVELVRGAGVEVVSSADLVQYFEARWTPVNLERHLEAGRKIDELRRDAFRLVSDCLRNGRRVTEFDVKRFILDGFKQAGLTTDHGPIVAVNENCSNPHYEPEQDAHREIRRGDVLLIDMWAKTDAPGGVYYDITWTGFCGSEPPGEVVKVFEVVREARDRAVKTVQEAVSAGRELRGYEVDDAARGFIREQGYGEYFVHRTGHSIGTEVHGAGANMDNLETHDERRVIPWTCFSVEPGIYLPKFGIRSEVNVFVGEDGARVTGEIQQRLVTL